MGRSFEGRTAGSREEEGGTWELDHTNILVKSTFTTTWSHSVVKEEITNMHGPLTLLKLRHRNYLVLGFG